MKTIQQAFVLSGGGARGIAHFGVLQAFMEKGVFPSVISATSAGALAAIFLCDGYTPEEAVSIFERNKITAIFDWRSLGKGLLSLRNHQELLRKYIRCKSFEELQIPLFVSTTHFTTGHQKVFHSGEIIPVLLASCSIPLFFPPVLIDNEPYVDGGLSSNLPVEPLLGHYKHIIGVHANPIPEYKKFSSIISNADRTMHLSIRNSVIRNIPHCALFIEPKGLENFGLFEVKKVREIYELGYHYTKQLLESHQISSSWPPFLER